MEIKSKEEFIDLFLSVMARNGILIETFDLKKEILSRLDDRRFGNIFYFFENLSDLDFSKILNKYTDEWLIEGTKNSDETYTIKLRNEFVFPISSKILSSYDEEIINTMSLLLKEINLSNRLKKHAGTLENLSYLLANPNRIYKRTQDSRIVTDGKVTKLDDTLELVIDASFVIVEEFNDNKVTKLTLYYRFEDELYISNIITRLMKLEYIKELQSKEKYEEENMFTQNEDGVNLQYRGF